MAKVAIIGGTGVYDPSILGEVKDVTLETPYGKMSAVEGTYKGVEVIFMNRHGSGHSVPPHMINYRANIWGLKKLGATKVLATAAVGSLNMNMAPGNFVFPDQFIEFTKARKCTFFDGGEMGVVHTDMTRPYCSDIVSNLEMASLLISHTSHSGGIYVCAEGPRFETPAEIKMYRHMGGDIVGMTSFPEVALCRELGMCYATVAMVTNYAAGVRDVKLTHAEVLEVMAENSENIKSLLLATVPLIAGEQSCGCDASAPKI
ncbi:MAG: S-methyl-5'-thioadenosine phosphorylase [Clostridiales bacterium]